MGPKEGVGSKEGIDSKVDMFPKVVLIHTLWVKVKGIKEFSGMKSSLLPFFLRSTTVFKKDTYFDLYCYWPGSGYMACGVLGLGMDMVWTGTSL